MAEFSVDTSPGYNEKDLIATALVGTPLGLGSEGDRDNTGVAEEIYEDKDMLARRMEFNDWAESRIRLR